MIDETMYKKIGLPLKMVVQTCQAMEKSQDLNLFEQTFQKPMEYNLKFKLELMRFRSQLIMYRLDDIRDWQSLNRGDFRKHR